MKNTRQANRRSFLKNVGAAGLVAAIPQLVPARLLGKNAPSNTLNLAVLGCGVTAREDIRACLDENIVAICDVDQRQVTRTKDQLAELRVPDKAKVYEDYRKLLDAEKSLDAVVIATGQRWHVPMCRRALLAGKHVYCETPLAHSVAEAREIRELGRQTKLVTQVGLQGGATRDFRRSVEVIQAGVLGSIREVHCWSDRFVCDPSEAVDEVADAISQELNWDFWCGPSKVLPYKMSYSGFAAYWGRWLAYGDGELAETGVHAFNLPWRALKLGAPLSASVEIPEPLKDSYPSAVTVRWEFAARGDLPPVTLWWRDGADARPPKELWRGLVPKDTQGPTSGILFVGEKGSLECTTRGWGGDVQLQGEAQGRPLRDHEACKPIPVTLPRAKRRDPSPLYEVIAGKRRLVGGISQPSVPMDHLGEWLTACKGGPKTFHSFDTAAAVDEIAMVGMLAMRLGRPIQWDSDALKVPGVPEADALIHRPQRTKWL